jgi:hypothetical protein
MQLENEAHDLERIAKAHRLISTEISYGGLTNAVLGVAMENSGAVRDTVLLSEATAPTRSATERTDMDALSPSNSCAPPARDPAAALEHPSSPATAALGSLSGSAPLSREKTRPTCKKLFRRKSGRSDAQWERRIFCSRRWWVISPKATKKRKAGWAQYKFEKMWEEREKRSPLEIIRLNRIIADAAPARCPRITSVEEFLAKVGATHCPPAFAASPKQACKP